MGCDIHMHVEVCTKRADPSSDYGYNRWRLLTQINRVEEHPTSAANTDYLIEWYPGRNYDEFAILAGVRNGRGFAGVDTGDGFIPLSAPKGLPADVSHEVEQEYARWGTDGHSHSWLTLVELKATPEYWAQTTRKRGLVTKKEAAQFRATGERPNSWLNAIGGVKAENYEQIEWGIPYADRAPYLLRSLIPRLEAIVGWGGLGYSLRGADSKMTAEDIRIVFWFDS